MRHVDAMTVCFVANVYSMRGRGEIVVMSTEWENKKFMFIRHKIHIRIAKENREKKNIFCKPLAVLVSLHFKNYDQRKLKKNPNLSKNVLLIVSMLFRVSPFSS